MSDFLQIHCLVLSLGLGAFFYFFGRDRKDRIFTHMSELWFSLGSAILASYLFQKIYTYWSMIFLLVWIWPVRNIARLVFDFSLKRVPYTYTTSILSIGVFLSLCLGLYSLPLEYCILPFGLSYVFVASWVIINGFKKQKNSSLTFLVNSTLALLLLAFIQHSVSLFVHEGPYFQMFQLMTVVFLGLSSFSLSLLKSDIKEQEKLIKTLSVRDHQILAMSDSGGQNALCAGLTHELSGPLTVLQARIGQALKREDNYFEIGTIKSMQFQVERMIKAVETVREIIHNDDGVEGRVELHEVIENVMALVAQRYANHGVNIRVYGNISGEIIGNKILLEQAILHILHNSFEALEFLSDKWIEISMISLNDKYQLFFKDSGNGIPDDIQEKMMTPLFTTKLNKSLGMGLNTVQRIIQNFGGNFYYSNQKNTTFVIELPKSKMRLLDPEWKESIVLSGPKISTNELPN